jgi:hypothetical protein
MNNNYKEWVSSLSTESTTTNTTLNSKRETDLYILKITSNIIPELLNWQCITVCQSLPPQSIRITSKAKNFGLPLILYPSIYEKFAKFERFSAFMTLNYYKLLVIRDIMDGIDKDGNGVFDLICITSKLFNDILNDDSIFRFLCSIMTSLRLNDIICMVEYFKINLLMYNETITQFYIVTDFDSPVIVIQYKNSTDINYIGTYRNLYSFDAITYGGVMKNKNY